MVLVLWGSDKLAADLGIEDEGALWGGLALAHNVASRDEVDDVLDLARRNGAEITREPSETLYGGHAGGFRDLEGHVWEVAQNPTFGLRDDGSVLLPER